MRARRTVDEITGLLRDLDRVAARRLTVEDDCRSAGVAEAAHSDRRERTAAESAS